MKKLLSLSVLIAMLWGCCTVEDTPKTEEKDKPVNYKVTFDANGGKGKMPEQIFAADTSQPLNPNTFKRVGYVFTEWNTEADGNGVTYMSGSYYSLTSDITLYAQWAAEEAKKDDTEEKPDNPEKPIQLYSVIFMSQYGNVPDDIVGLKENDKLTSSQLPKLTTDGYTFAGWYNGETKIEAGYKITGNLKLTGKWDANVYTVKFNANGGSGNMAEMSFNYNEEKALTANTFTRDDYAFAGWAVSADGNAAYADMGKVKNLTSENNATVILYAVWNENNKVLPVIFSLPDGTAVECGDSITLSCGTEGAKICYTIDGVTAEYTSEITITEDVTVTAFATKDGMKDSNVSTASYAVKTYTVTYTTEYAVVPNKISGLKKGYTLTVEQLPELTTDGYTFAGWYNGETKIETGYTITEDLSLTAKWNVNNDTVYTVEHCQQNIIDDEYTVTETESKNGATGENTSATAKDYAGFTVKSVEQEKIAANGSTVVKIYYDRNTITLTLNLDGGEGDESISGKYEEAVTTPANPTKTGYTFAGWNPSLPAAFPAKNATYTAKWNANTYTVKFNANGGIGNMGNQTFTYDTEQALPANTFTRADYAFAGWAVSADGNAAYTDMGKVKNLTSENNATVTLYAVWTEKDKVLPVVFSLPDGTSVDSGESVTLSCATEGAKISYTIDGVTAEYTNAITITKNVTVTAFAAKDGMKNSDVSTASYTVKTYTVTYTNEYGVAPSKISGLKKGDTLTAGQLPELTSANYTFVGWYNGETKIEAGYKITGNLKLTAKWTLKTYTVTFDANGGSGTMEKQEFVLGKSQQLNSNTFNLDGYTVTEWNTEADGNGITYMSGSYYSLNEDITLYAQWTPNNYTVKFDSNGGNGSMENLSFIYDKEKVLTANIFTRDGYEFGGWAVSADGEKMYNDNESVKNLTTDYDGEVTLYAKWLELYTITYELDGGTNADSNPEKYTVETEDIILAEATRKCYTFAGWYIDEECSDGITEITKGTTGDITLYAKWIANNYTVAFDANGGTGKMPSQVFTFGTLQPLNSNTSKRTGCTFKEWNTKPDGSGDSYIAGESYTFGEDTTLYAQWTANKVGISVMLPEYNDAEINLQQVTNENTVTFTAAGGFDSYGWYIDGVKQSETSATFAIDTSIIEPANYKVMVIVADGDEYYSATADLEVKRVQ